MSKSKVFVIGLVVLILLLSACAPKVVKETVIVEKAVEKVVKETVVVEKPVEKVVKETVVVEKVVTATPPEKAKIAFWYTPASGGTGVTCFVETVVYPFNAQSDTVEVHAVAQPNRNEAIRTALAGGAGPDVAQVPGVSYVAEYANAGYLLPLGELADEFGWSDLFVPWALSSGVVDGKLYTLPGEYETLVIFYNKTLFEEKGWEPPETIDELMELCERIAAEGIIPFASGNAEWRGVNEWFVGEFLNHVAGPQKVYEALIGQRSWTDPDFVQAIELLNEIQQNGWIQGGLDRYYTATFDEFSAAFGNGEAAMVIEGTWAKTRWGDHFGEAAGNTNEWDWIPMPSATGDVIFDVGIGINYSINKNSENPRAAAEFLAYYFSPEVQARLLRECGMDPGPIRLQAGTLTGVDPRTVRMAEALSKASEANNYGYTTWTFWGAKSNLYMYEEIEKVWAGQMTAEEYLEGLQELFSEELAAGEVPPIPTR